MISICKRCERKSLIYAKGLCFSCYVILRNKKNPEKDRRRVRKWRKKNRHYWRNYQRRKRKIPKERYRIKD